MSPCNILAQKIRFKRDPTDGVEPPIQAVAKAEMVCIDKKQVNIKLGGL